MLWMIKRTCIKVPGLHRDHHLPIRPFLSVVVLELIFELFCFPYECLQVMAAVLPVGSFIWGHHVHNLLSLHFPFPLFWVLLRILHNQDPCLCTVKPRILNIQGCQDVIRKWLGKFWVLFDNSWFFFGNWPP